MTTRAEVALGPQVPTGGDIERDELGVPVSIRLSLPPPSSRELRKRLPRAPWKGVLRGMLHRIDPSGRVLASQRGAWRDWPELGKSFTSAIGGGQWATARVQRITSYAPSQFEFVAGGVGYRLELSAGEGG